MSSRIIILVCGLCFSVLTWAEGIPVDYYTPIQGTQDAALKTALHEIIFPMQWYQYGTTKAHFRTEVAKNDTMVRGFYYAKGDTLWRKGDPNIGTWAFFPTTDRALDGSIWDMYSHSKRYLPYQNGESACGIQIEHCLPKSWWGKDDSCDQAYCDLYNLNPSDAQTNGQKSNCPPGHVVQGDKFDNGSFRMDSKSKSSYNWVCFEPEAQYRGDFARAYFYIATAYEHLNWVKDYKDYISNDSYLAFQPTLIQVLLDWHRSDPVDEKELRRLDAISSVQHNRNPYIDYPELVEYIWGNKQGQKVDLSQLICRSDTVLEPIVYPEPVDPHTYDTLIALPAVTKKLVEAAPGGFASAKIQSAGTASITMGASTTDGYIAFSGLELEQDAILTFRASPYQTATEMKLEIYARKQLVTTITEKVAQSTRYEKTYQVTIPAETDSITILSVGGSTTKRACMQELYLLVPKKATHLTQMVSDDATAVRKEMVHGQVVILKNGIRYSIHGQILPK